MDPTRYNAIREVFLAVRELTGDERARRLNELCGDDHELRAEVEVYLGGDPESEALFVGDGPTVQMPEATRERSGQRIGRYKLLEPIGRGGFGVVWLAEQEEPVRRRVALKIIQVGMDTAQVIARFEAERQALAVMDHPNIATVLDAGCTDAGRPYFVMEYVPGELITDYCDRMRVPTRERLELFMQSCEAIQHAHQKGIIHRDVKPSNVLVAEVGGKPTVKVIDFGIAKATSQKLTERTLWTRQGQIVGTPAYMSPEQAEARALDIDTRSDIYSLGVLLYELLTGALPLDVLEAGYAEMQRIIREETPAPPSARLSSLGDVTASLAESRRSDPASMLREMRGDLDWITMQCLEKDRTRRYASAGDLIADVRNYLNDEPVVARPPSNVYRLRKFARRNRGLVIGVAAVVVALLAGVAGSTYYALESAESARDARQALSQTHVIRRFLQEDIIGIAIVERQRAADVQSLLLVDAVVRASRRIWSRTFADRSTEAELHSTLGTALLSLSRLEPAEKHLRHAIAVRPDDMDQLRLVEVLYRQGRSDEAMVMLPLALEPDVEPADAAYALLQFGNAAKHDMQYDVAEQAYDDARDRIAGREDLERLRLRIRYNRALLDVARERFTRAHVQMDEVYRRSVDVLGSDDHETIYAISELASILNRLDRLEEAEPLYEQAIDQLTKKFGADHWRTLEAQVNHATLLRKLDRSQEAADAYAVAYAGYQVVRGPDDTQTVHVALLTARALAKVERYGEAAEAIEVVVRAYDAQPEAEPTERLATLDELYRDLPGEHQDASVVEAFRRILGRRTPGKSQDD